MKQHAIATLVTVFLIGAPSAHASQVSGPRPGGGGMGAPVLRAVAGNWAGTISRYFNSRTPDISRLREILPALGKLDLADPAVRAALELVTREIEAAAGRLVAAQNNPGSASLAGNPQEKAMAVAEVFALLDTPAFSSLLSPAMRDQVRLHAERSRGGLPDPQELDAKMRTVAGLLSSSSAAVLSDTETVDASGRPSSGAGDMPREWRMQPARKAASDGEAGRAIATEESYRPGPEETAFRGRMISLLAPYVKRQDNGMANLSGYLGAGDYGTMAYFVSHDFYHKGFIAGRGALARLFYRSYRKAFLKNPVSRWARLLGRWASPEATDYLTALSELGKRGNSMVSSKAVSWREELDQRAARLAAEVSEEDLGRLAQEAQRVYSRRDGSGELDTGSMSHDDKAILVELYRFYVWMNARVEDGTFTPYYAQVIKGNTYRFTFDNGLTPFAQWAIFDHEPLPEP